ncbi:MAG: hypothetical protein IPM56_07360 [Ignavibacteriales bacterium]|nr:MAG: hypothetical protein IPM56_07360 [Ignavibacteriales bacterium]
MKLFLCVLFSFLVISNTLADDKYEKAMKKNLSKMDTTNSAEGFVEIANGFERIALAEKDKWLPYYYVSFCYTLASYSEKVNAAKDVFLDKAFSFLKISDSLQADNSEVYTLFGMIAQARMQVDPMNRWMKYGAEADKNFTKAVKLDTLNPRPEYLIGTGLFYTPEQFGGGPVTAKPVLEKSLDKFNKFVPASDIAPNWGRKNLEGMLEQINKKG